MKSTLSKTGLSPLFLLKVLLRKDKFYTRKVNQLGCLRHWDNSKYLHDMLSNPGLTATNRKKIFDELFNDLDECLFSKDKHHGGEEEANFNSCIVAIAFIKSPTLTRLSYEEVAQIARFLGRGDGRIGTYAKAWNKFLERESIGSYVPRTLFGLLYQEEALPRELILSILPSTIRKYEELDIAKKTHVSNFMYRNFDSRNKEELNSLHAIIIVMLANPNLNPDDLTLLASHPNRKIAKLATYSPKCPAQGKVAFALCHSSI